MSWQETAVIIKLHATTDFTVGRLILLDHLRKICSCPHIIPIVTFLLFVTVSQFSQFCRSVSLEIDIAGQLVCIQCCISSYVACPCGTTALLHYSTMAGWQRQQTCSVQHMHSSDMYPILPFEAFFTVAAERQWPFCGNRPAS